MPTLFADRVKETSTSTSNGNFTLDGAPNGFKTFNTSFGTNVNIYYCIAHQSAAVNEWEVGIGYLSNATTLVRTTVYAGTNGTSKVSFSAGAKDVFSTIPAYDVFARGLAIAHMQGLALP